MKKLFITFLLTVFCFAGIANAKPEPRPTFDGVTVTAALHSGPFVNAWGPHVKRIKELYGINLELVGIPVNELYDKSILELSMGTGAFDIVQYNPGWVGDYIDFIRPLDDYMDRWDPGWMDIHEGFREWENTYGGQRVSLTMDGDVMIFYYNKNMFEDPKEMADFKSTYGYDLAPPANYDQVLDIQKHFQRDTDGDGTIDQAGYSDPIIKRGRGQYPYLMRLFAYQKEAGIKPNYFDPDTMEPLINTPEGVKALQNYVDTVANGVPGMLQWEWSEAHTCFMTGKCASLIHWPDEGLMTAAFTANTGSAMGFADVPSKANMTCGGWVAGVTADSQNPEAAYMVLDYILGPDVSTHVALYPGGGTDLFRQSHFDSAVVKMIAPQEYLDAFDSAIGDIVGELRIPGGFEYYDSLDIQVQKALAGEISAQEALDQAAKNWKKITKSLGADKQKEMYAKAMGY